MDLSLALGGGGAKGNSHLGVLRVLEEEGFKVGAVAGTSFGGIVACFYAVGYSPGEIEDIFAEVDQTRLYGRTADENPALLGLGRVRHWLSRTLGDRTFADARIPCAVTAVDLKNSREIVIREGTLRDAILCTIALPGIFPAFMKEGLELVDGGLLNPVPVEVARSLAPTLPVVAVSLTQPLGSPPHSISLPILDGIPEPLARQISRLRLAQAMHIFMQSLDIGGRQIAELRFRLEKPDVIIRPRVANVPVLDEVDVHEVSSLGEQAARASLPDLHRVTSWGSRVRRWARTALG